MEELLPSAPFLLPSFRCYLSSPLMYAYSTFSGKKNILVRFYLKKVHFPVSVVRAISPVQF